MSMKVLFIGDGAVGKTALISRLLKHSYDENYNPTNGMSSHMMDSNILICDCGGENVGLKDAYYIGANIAFIVFDQSNPSSVGTICNWYKQLKRVGVKDIYLVKNKCDLNMKIPKDIAKDKIKEFIRNVRHQVSKILFNYKFNKYIKTSAKTGHGVDMLLSILQS